MCSSPSACDCNSSGKRSTCLTAPTLAECARRSFLVPPRPPPAELRGLRASSLKPLARLPSEHLPQRPVRESCNSPLSFSFRPTDQSRDGFTNFPYKSRTIFLFFCAGAEHHL